MDIATIIGYVSNMGFPTILCFILFYKLDKDNDRHKEEVSKLSDVIEKNTDAIEKLSDKIDDLELYNKIDRRLING